MEDVLDDEINELDFSDDETREELIAFVGEKYNYYFSKWFMFLEGKWASFNLSSFFLGIMWFLYRKMYLEVGVIIACLMLEGIIVEFVFVEGTRAYQVANIISRIVYSLFITITANYLYLKSTERKIAQLKNKGYSRDELLRRISKKGGTSFASVFLVISVFILLFVVVYSLDPTLME